jgi:CRP/FNR family transcriptional regulator, anaerobic regulatory protein
MSQFPLPDILGLFGYAALDHLELRELQRLAKPVYLRSGQNIVTEGMVTDAVYGLLRGTVRLYKHSPDGRRQVLGFALPGDFVGFPNRADRYTLSADAIGEVAVSRFPRNDLLRFARTSHNMMQLMIEFTARELEQARDQMLLLGCGSAEEKVTAFLINWRNNLARRNPVPNVVPLPMLRRDIADYLGLKQETVSRTIAKLIKKKAIRVVSHGVDLLNTSQAVAPRIERSVDLRPSY